MSFWGCVLKPGQKKPVNIGSSDVLHLSQACLYDPKPGKNYLQVEVEGKTFNIACLEKDKRDHDGFDLFFEANASFKNNGATEIHLMGNIEPADMNDEGEESEEEEGSEQQGIPQQKASSPKPTLHIKAGAMGSESDDGLELGDEEGEESEEESPAQQTLPPKSSPKRKAVDEPPGPPAKKAQSEGPDPALAAEKEAYVQKLCAYLKANGKTNVGQLGSKVPRPNGVPKLKAIFEQHKDKFNVVGDMVTPR